MDISPVENYIGYLRRLGRTKNTSLYELHQLALSREAARVYGLTDEQIEGLDRNLKEANL